MRKHTIVGAEKSCATQLRDDERMGLEGRFWPGSLDPGAATLALM